MVTSRRKLAGRLRRLANQLDRAAWEAEQAGLVVKAHDIPAGPLIHSTREHAQTLRRLAHRLNPPSRRSP